MSIPRLIPWALALAACSDKGDDSSGGGGNLPDGCEDDMCEYAGLMPNIVNKILEQASSDPQFADDFAPLVQRGKEAMGAFEQSFANYLGNLYGCPGVPEYTGPTMASAHTGMNITPQEYDDFVAIITTTMADSGISNDVINACFAPALTNPSLVSQITGR
jgi:hypothetical protein